MPPKAPPPFVLNKKLILHFDVSDVITYERVNKQLQILKLVSKFAWGRIEQKDAKSPKVWKLVIPTLSTTSMQSLEQQPLLSYSSYIDSIQGEISQEESNKNKEQLLMNFTKGPGAKLKTQIQKLMRSINIPKTLIDYVNVQEESKQEVSKEYRKLLETLTHGKYQILPSFFKLLMNLKKAKRQFALIFHASSQVKHEAIIGELNLFFKGEHPFYNGKNNSPLVKFDGSKNCKNFVITPKNTYVSYRFGKTYDDDYATFGTIKSFSEADIDGLKQKLLEIKDQTKLCQSSEIYIYSHLLLKESAAIYCVDNLGYMMIDRADYDTQEIYFNSRDIQIWSCLGEQIIPGQNIYNVKVETFQLMKDIEYFIKNVQIAEKNMLIEIQRLQKGDPIAHKPKQQAVQLSDSEYLKANILPLLEGALRLVDIQRPNDPITAIAFYCLKNQHWLVKPQEQKTSLI